MFQNCTKIFQYCLLQATGSHGGSHSVDERRSNDNADDEDDDDDYRYHEIDDDDCSYHQGNDHVHVAEPPEIAYLRRRSSSTKH